MALKTLFDIQEGVDTIPSCELGTLFVISKRRMLIFSVIKLRLNTCDN